MYTHITITCMFVLPPWIIYCPPYQERPPTDHKNPELSEVPNSDKRSSNPSAVDQNQQRKPHERVTRHMQQVDNTSHSRPGKGKESESKEPEEEEPEKATEAATHTTLLSTKPMMSFRPLTLPSEHKDCDIKGKKDAQSAISRARTQECKDLIHNITCSQMAGLLYDTGIKRECGSSKAGKGFQAKSFTEGTGPLGRVAFLLSLHGRAFRQVKRLMKAVYHSDHYYFIHVDSVSSVSAGITCTCTCYCACVCT